MFDLHPGDRALVLAPHPDDETLGPGGTIALLAAAGVEVHVLAVTCTTITMHGGTSDPALRLAEFDAACAVLGVEHHQLAWVDTAAARDPSAYLGELVTLIESGPGPSLQRTRPDLLLLPTAESHHQDHLATHRAGIAAVRGGDPRDRWIPRIVAGYDGPEDQVWRAAGAARPIVVDISGVADVKDKAVACYRSQLRPRPHPRRCAAVAALDVAAGVAVGCDRAERFALYRMAVRA